MSYRKSYGHEPKQNIQIMKNDHAVFSIVNHYQFVSMIHLYLLFPERNQRYFRARINELTHHGFLDRVQLPKNQQSFKAGKQPYIYCLTNKSARELKAFGFDRGKAKRYLQVAPGHILHALGIANVDVAFRCALGAASDVRYHSSQEMLSSAPLHIQEQREPWAFAVPTQWQGKIKLLPVVPDLVFRYTVPTGTPVLCLVEIDRGTMPVYSLNLERSSLYKKYLAYYAALENNLFAQRYQQPRVQILTLTTSVERQNHALLALKEAKRMQSGAKGLDHFLFGLNSDVHPSTVLTHKWQQGNGHRKALVPHVQEVPKVGAWLDYASRYAISPIEPNREEISELLTND